MRHLVLWPGLLVLTACHQDPAALQSQPTPVRLAVVEAYRPTGGQNYSASIMPNRQVNLSFKVSGIVSSLQQVQGADGRMRAVDLGDVVKQGTALAQVRRQDYEFQVSQVEGQLQQAKQSEQAAGAQLQQAEASALKAKEDYERADALYKKASLTRSDYDAAKANLDASRAQVDAARAQQQASAGAMNASTALLGSANLSLGDTTLVAPFAGVVVQRSIELGSLAGPGAVAIVLADISSVEATFAVSDIAVAHLRKGSSLTAYAEAFPNRMFRGFVNTISSVADSNTRSFQVAVSIPNGNGMLRPGMIVSLDVGQMPSVSTPLPVVPLNAVLPAGDEAGHFAVMSVVGGVAKRVPVTLGATYGDRVAVSGIAAGEKVVGSGATFVQDGDAVTVIP